MAKSIVTVGFEIPGYSEKYLPLSSGQSLLDYDIIVFAPDISGMFGYGVEQYQGKPCLGDDASFKLKEKVERWRQELVMHADNHRNAEDIYFPATVIGNLNGIHKS